MEGHRWAGKQTEKSQASHRPCRGAERPFDRCVGASRAGESDSHRRNGMQSSTCAPLQWHIINDNVWLVVGCRAKRRSLHQVVYKMTHVPLN